MEERWNNVDKMISCTASTAAAASAAAISNDDCHLVARHIWRSVGLRSTGPHSTCHTVGEQSCPLHSEPLHILRASSQTNNHSTCIHQHTSVSKLSCIHALNADKSQAIFLAQLRKHSCSAAKLHWCCLFSNSNGQSTYQITWSYTRLPSVYVWVC